MEITLVTAKFSVVATGGTFDEIHLGHLAILTKAFEMGDKVVIGVTSDEYAANEQRKSRLTHRYEKRVANLRRAIRENFGEVTYEISKLTTPYGPTVLTGKVKALVVSRETASVGSEINEIRARKGINALAIIIVEMIKAEDGARISSSRIRTGEIDSMGRVLKGA
jgi:pantetheine-phosphate adenylyltransferase